ncbi:hypothetical protein ARMGADRAFT_32333 [Armillaria gallica]|uniref:Uncharacterized protein n=1 Tax=Armillaria gallica TaxID=47427 RepID=A0A2H3EZC4_ARMGA|nr:hypothetical protein ARMGADRAFT_32333 [Armillaria gallica]
MGFLTQSGYRWDVLGMTLQDWERALHPRLKFLGMFLFRLCEQMTPEYGFVSPPPEDHLHEAFQRLILNQIDEMAEDIELDTEKLREVPELRQQKHQATTGASFGPSLGQSSSSLSKRRLAKRSAPSEGKPTHSI